VRRGDLLLSGDPFAGVLDPFAYWDIAATYDHYAAFFDLVVYCAIFMALTHVVFTRRFSGRPGKVMATTIGLALGISLAVAGHTFGFSLRDAGPIAVLLALLLVGFLVLQTLVHIHVSWTLAVPLTYVIIYLFVRAMSPSLFGLIADRVPFINLLSVIVFLICLWRVGVALWPGRNGHGERGGGDASFIARLDHKDEERELKVEKQVTRKTAPQVVHENRRIEHTLEAVQGEVRREKPDWRAVAQALSNIAHRSDDVIRTVDRIRVLDRRLGSYDWRQLGQLNGYYGQLNDGEKERLKEQILLERGKILQEHAINDLAERCERRHSEFRRLLDEAQKACYAQDRDGASHQIAEALSIEARQRDELRLLQRAEKRLLDLTRLKLRKE
jgi:hypothetical protein